MELCSTKNPSILRRIEVDQIANINFQEIRNEAKERAPILYGLLNHAINKKSTSEVDKGVAIAYSVILRLRCKDMSRIQHAIGQILDLGGATDEVYINTIV